jgi:hypothetical protein
MGERRDVHWVLVENPDGRAELGDPGIDEYVTLKLILGRRI